MLDKHLKFLVPKNCVGEFYNNRRKQSMQKWNKLAVCNRRYFKNGLQINCDLPKCWNSQKKQQIFREDLMTSFNWEYSADMDLEVL